MEYRHLGNSGLEVSVIGLGCNNFGRRCDAAMTAQVVNQALDQGINFLDTSDSYGPAMSEEYIGQALKGRRREAVIGTKFASVMGEGPMWSGGSRRYIMNAVHDSLRRLNTDYIDLYQIHFPDPKTPIDETLRALDDLVRSGVVRYIGNSNFTGSMIVDAAWTSQTEHLSRFISAQNQYNVLDRGVEADVVPACAKFGLGLIPYSPLASGLLTGKYRPGQPSPEGARLSNPSPYTARILNDENLDKVMRLEQVAQERGHSVGELAIAWLAAQPAVSSVIAGATRPDQVDENARSGEWKMTADDLAAVDAALQGV